MSVLIIRPYIEGTRSTVWTDDDSLEWVLNLADSIGRLDRWRLGLLKYGSDEAQRAELKYQAADALYRQRTTGEFQTYLDDNTPVLAIDEQKSSEEGIYTIPIHGNQNVSLQATDKQTLNAPLKWNKLVLKQKHDEYCQTAALHMERPNIELPINNQSNMVRRSTVDKVTHTVVPELLRSRVLYLAIICR